MVTRKTTKKASKKKPADEAPPPEAVEEAEPAEAAEPAGETDEENEAEDDDLDADLDDEGVPVLRGPVSPVSTKPLREPARRHGSPMLAAIPITSKWTTKAGGELTLEIAVRNGGGAGKGVWVELGGPAAASVELNGMTLERASEPRMEGARVVFSDAVIPAGYEPVKKGEAPPPDERAVLRVVLRATRAGSSLLTVRVGHGAVGSTSGSALVGRTLEIVG